MKKYDFGKDCCNHYDGTNLYYLGYAVLPCFKVAQCQDCGDVRFLASGFMGWLFETFFAPFWKGRIKVFPETLYKNENGTLVKVTV